MMKQRLFPFGFNQFSALRKKETTRKQWGNNDGKIIRVIAETNMCTKYVFTHGWIK